VFLQQLPRVAYWMGCAAVVLLLAGTGAPVASLAGDQPVEPLEVPRGPGPEPEGHRELDPLERIELGLEAQRERGYRERPMLAWALLEEAHRTSNVALFERAVEVAPTTPRILFEALRAGASRAGIVELMNAFRECFPALVWLIGVALIGLVLGLLGAGGIVAGVGFARTLQLHGHVLLHLLKLPSAPAWAGPLIVLAGLGLLSLCGVGPVPIVGVMLALAIVGSSPSQASVLASLGVLATLALGPGLDLASRALTHPVAEPFVASAWRVDRSQPFPEDLAYLEAAARGPGENGAGGAESTASPDALAVYAWANALKHQGELDAAERVIQARRTTSRVLEERSSNLLGILHLARGNVANALSEFERARAIGESATILYNLSQTYARDVELLKRESLYAAALDLDPNLVSQYAALEGSNVHRYVIQEPLPMGAYLERVFRSTAQSEAWAGEWRTRLLGPLLPRVGWIGLLALIAAGWALRQDRFMRCRRCDRAMCRKCKPSSGGTVCNRCERLFSPRARIDARVRKQQAEIDRRDQLRLRLIRSGASIAFPGVGDWLHGNAWLGGLRLVLAAVALGSAFGVLWSPAPFEVGGVTQVAAYAAWGVLLLLYAYEWIGVRQKLRAKGKT